MRSIEHVRELVLWLFLAVVPLACGCASASTNQPPKMKPGFGELHIYAPGETNLNWEVQRFDPKAERYRVLYSKLKTSPAVTLPLKAGPHQLRITALNRLVLNPATVAVSVQEQTACYVRGRSLPSGRPGWKRAPKSIVQRCGGIRRAARYGSTKSPVYSDPAEASSEPPP
jgi:hypothetical protein